MSSLKINSARGLLRISRYLFLSLGLLLAILVIQRIEGGSFSEAQIEKRTLRKIEKIKAKLEIDVDGIEHKLEDSGFNLRVLQYDTFFEELTDRHDYSIFVFLNDSLVYWTNNSVPVESSFSSNGFEDGLFFCSNTWGLCSTKLKGDYHIVGFIHLQRSYPYENDFLSNEYILGSGITSAYKITRGEGENLIEVKGDNGEVLFSLEPDDDNSQAYTGRGVTLFILSLLLVLSVLLLLQDLVVWGSKRKMTNWWLLGMAADLVLLRWLMIKFELPGPIYESAFFQPIENGISFFNSQGDLLVSAVFILVFAYQFMRIFKLYPDKIINTKESVNPRVIDSFTILGWTGLLLGFFGMHWLFDSILSARGSLLEVYKVLTIDLTNLSDLLFFIMILAAFSFFVRSISIQLVAHYSVSRLAIILIVSMLIVVVFSRGWGFVPWPVGLLLLLILVAIFSYSELKGRKRMNHSSSVMIVIIGAIFLTQFIYKSNQEKEYMIKKELIESLAYEHDLIAEEMLLPVIEGEIQRDVVLADYVLNPVISEGTVTSYLQSKYFGFYWNRYEIAVNICDSLNDVNIIHENRVEPCLAYFTAPIDSSGSLIPGTSFYYLDNFDGRINYVGKYPYYNIDSTYVSYLFISLDSRLISQDLGYPDLLISGSAGKKDSLLPGYSYAKYQHGILVSKSGDYTYSTSSVNYPSDEGRLLYFIEDKHEHLIHKMNSEQTIILTSPKFRLWDHIVSFSYVFVVLYIIWLLATLIYYFPGSIRRPDRGLKTKIEFIMVGVLLVSFILIGGGITYYIADQYDERNRNTIAEKTQSVLIELSHKLIDEPVLTSEWSSESYPSLGGLLVKFSYVFNSDINLYSTNGEILATSRPEIIDRQLVSRYMDPAAYHELSIHNQMEYVHFENIGKLRYWSSYAPFYNVRNELIAYINLPYFDKQSIIRQEISTFIVAILNAYFLLIFLAVILAVFLSNQVTRPLRLLQEKFAKVELGGVNLPIDYEGKDEIGGLVKSYNRMVDELEVSAEKLARSERETAWREMARQIAHEIKNPLTPMKLSVQHLKKAWDDKAEDWETYFNRVSQTLIEQINSLSSIADEFAQFARMPKSKLKVVDIGQRLAKSASLFELSESCKIEITGDPEPPKLVYIDEEQLQQVLNNLFKNAFQAVPKVRKPEIRVNFQSKEGKVIVSITDNGNGVDPEIKEKLFQPNFTTKTSGMGLGLAISKKIIESVSGEIWYETERGAGSTFYISLPLMQN